MTGRLDRRGFLMLGGAALAATALAACSGGKPADLGTLGSIYRDRDSLERIGRAAAKAPGVERDADDLSRALAPSGSSSRWVRTAGEQAVRRHLDAAVAADFSHDRIVDVAGWQLPLTEARVAALVYVSR
jgi:hypothetical protein